MGDRLGIQGAVGFIFTLLTVTGALILPARNPLPVPAYPSRWSTPWRSSKQQLDSHQVSTATPR